MKQGKLQIHSENILPIIKKWLYTDKEIFLRELVSNATDAIYKLKRLSELKEAEIEETFYRIDIKTDKKNKTLTISDNGIGMTSDEVERYITQIAFSGAKEFIEKYEQKSEDQIIGHFGLGFFSAYMVAKKVDIHTRSYRKESEGVFWSCDGSSDYTIEKEEIEKRGTALVLHLSEEETEYLEPTKLRAILDKYCAYLPFPIYLNDIQVNSLLPIWVKGSHECTDKEYLDFYHRSFPLEEDPLFWIHLNVDFPFHLKGVLYFPQISKENNFKKEGIRLFCNRVFVSDQCSDILPEYLTMLRGVIDSPDIPLNVSRSSLQTDRTVKQLGQHISKKISDRLTSLLRTERDKFLSLYHDIEMILKLGALQDEKFYERIKECLIWKNSQGQWTTTEEYLERNKSDVVYYAEEGQENSHLLPLFLSKGVEVLFTRGSFVDQVLLSFLEQKLSIKFQRIDGGIVDPLCEPSKEKILLDGEGRTESSRMADYVKQTLPHLEVDAKSLASESLPALLVIKEEERRLRDALAFRNKSLPKALSPTFVVNTNSKLMQSIYALRSSAPQLAEELMHSVYDLTRLSQKEMEPEALSKFVSRSTELFEKLTVSLLEREKSN